MKHLQSDNAEYFPHGKIDMVSYGQGKLSKIAIENEQTVFRVSGNKTGPSDVIGIPRALAEVASHPTAYLPQASQAKPLIPSAKTFSSRGKEGAGVGGNYIR